MNGRIRVFASTLVLIAALRIDAACGKLVTGYGSHASTPCSASSASMAEDGAMQQWKNIVAANYGKLYADWANATNKTVSCPKTTSTFGCSVSCVVSAIPCTPTPQEKGDLLHLLAVTAKSPAAPYEHLWHSIRFATEYTWQDLRDVERVAGARGDFLDVDAAVVGTELHVLAVAKDGKLWHTVRGGGKWQDFRNVGAALNDPRPFKRVAAAAVGNDLHVVAIDGGGKLLHTIRFGTNTWQNFFGEVMVKTGAPADGDATMIDVAAAGIYSELHVLVVNGKGNLYHTIRRPNGWQNFLGDVRATAAPLNEQFRTVSAGDLGNQLHVCTTTASGGLYHTIRFPTAWQNFLGDVRVVTFPPAGMKFSDVSCRQSGGELHIAAVTSEGGLWHTIRRAGGWDRMANVEESNAGERGTVTAVAVTGIRVP